MRLLEASLSRVEKNDHGSLSEDPLAESLPSDFVFIAAGQAPTARIG